MELNKKTKNRLAMIILLCLAIFAVVSLTIQQSELVWIDEVMLTFADSLSTTTYQAFVFITNLGSKSIVISVGVLSLVVLWWKTKDYIGMVTIAVVLIGSNQLFKVLKELFKRERPINDPVIDALGYSFPSGHSTVSIAFYGILLFFIWKYMKASVQKQWILVLVSLYIMLIGFSRVLVKAHYVTDVLAGFTIGLVYVLICILIYNAILEKLNRPIINNKKSDLPL